MAARWDVQFRSVTEHGNYPYLWQDIFCGETLKYLYKAPVFVLLLLR